MTITGSRCSFCGKAQSQVARLVAGQRDVFICNECAQLVTQIVVEEEPEPRASTRQLTHVDEKGAARMVDVGPKGETERRAVARGKLALSRETVALVRDGHTPKGDVLAIARVAGIMGAKRTSDLIPLCHPLPLTHTAVDLRVEDDGIAIEATVATTARTGVEMEALTAVAVAGLTLYDMLKAVERTARLVDVRLVEKTGGRSGDVRLE